MSVDEVADEILATELTPALERKARALFNDAPYVTTVLFALEQWLQEQGDEKGYRIVEKCTLAMATHEAETV